MKDLRATQTKKEPPKEPEKGEKKSWKERMILNIPFCVCTILGAIVVVTLELNYILDYQIHKTTIYQLGLAAIVIYRAIRWYLGKPGWETLEKVMKAGIISAVILLPLVAGIAGYGREHYLAWKNETFQKNETAKAERERAQGMEAEIIRDISADGKKIEKGKVLPLVLVDNSIQKKADGPYRLIQVYMPDKTTEKISSQSKTAWVSMEDAIVRPKTLRYKDHNKSVSPDGKIWVIKFGDSEPVEFPIALGSRFLISASESINLQWPVMGKPGEFCTVPLNTEITNQIFAKLTLKGEAGKTITVKLL